MEYKKFEDTYVVRLDKGEEIITSLTRLADKENIRLASVSGLGAVNSFTAGVFFPEEKVYRKNDFPAEYHLHTLRHFFATYLLQNNTSKQVAADLLGHADTSFLERTYCHPQLESKQQAASILESMLEPAEQEAWEQEQREAQRASAAN